MQAFLSGSMELVPQQLTPHRELWDKEPRLGIGVGIRTRAAQEKMLYASSFMRLREDVKFRVEVIASRSDLRDKVQYAISTQPWLHLGGERKIAAVTLAEGDDLLDPDRNWPPSSGRFLTYLATPGRFAGGGWYPSSLAEKCRLVSAVIGSPEAVPGWDVAFNRPLQTQHAVPAGAVYFWEPADGEQDLQDPHGKSIADDPDDQQAGWGVCLRGEWDYVRER